MRRSISARSAGSQPIRQRREHALDHGPCAPHGLAAPARHDGCLAHPFDAASVPSRTIKNSDTSCRPRAEIMLPLGLQRNSDRIGFDVA